MIALAPGEGLPYVDLPYGIYIGVTNTYLFNRKYDMLWQNVNGVVTKMNPKRVITGIIETRYFYEDRNPPWSNDETMGRCKMVLQKFLNGIEVRGYGRSWGGWM